MWKNIIINIQNIEVETERAVLFNCPHSSNYDGYSFWHPAKLVRDGSHSYSVSVSYTEDFKFKLIKYSKSKHTKNILDEISIDYEEFEEMFGKMNENQDTETYLKIDEPEVIKVEESINKELIKR